MITKEAKSMKNIIAIKENERCCINCEHYRQFYLKNRGNVYMYFPTGYGVCVLGNDEKPQEPMKVCEHFEKEKKR